MSCGVEEGVSVLECLKTTVIFFPILYSAGAVFDINFAACISILFSAFFGPKKKLGLKSQSPFYARLVKSGRTALFSIKVENKRCVAHRCV